MTPKSLLRLPQAASRVEELAEGRFQPVLSDPAVDPAEVTRLVLCSGKIYYDIIGIAAARARTRASRSAASSCSTRSRRSEILAAGRELPEPRGGRLGAGGAAQHGRPRVHVPAPAADPAREPLASATSAAPSAPPPARATRSPTPPSRPASSRPRSTPRSGSRSTRGSPRRPLAARLGAQRPGGAHRRQRASASRPAAQHDRAQHPRATRSPRRRSAPRSRASARRWSRSATPPSPRSDRSRSVTNTAESGYCSTQRSASSDRARHARASSRPARAPGRASRTRAAARARRGRARSPAAPRRACGRSRPRSAAPRSWPGREHDEPPGRRGADGEHLRAAGDRPGDARCRRPRRRHRASRGERLSTTARRPSGESTAASRSDCAWSVARCQARRPAPAGQHRVGRARPGAAQPLLSPVGEAAGEHAARARVDPGGAERLVDRETRNRPPHMAIGDQAVARGGPAGAAEQLLVGPARADRGDRRPGGERRAADRPGAGEGATTSQFILPVSLQGPRRERPRTNLQPMRLRRDGSRRDNSRRTLHPEPRRARHGDRSRDGEHARVRRRPGDRRLRALGRRLRRRHRRGPRRRRRGRADDRPHAGDDLGHPPAAPRRDRRLRGHRGDAALLHPQGDRPPHRPPAADRVRALRASPRSRSGRSRRPRWPPARGACS